MAIQMSIKRWWYDERVRGVFFQVLAIVGVFLVFYYAIGNALNNLESRGITTGFGFLDDQAGFSIIQTLVPYNETYSFGRTFVVGLLNTILVSILGIILATILGFLKLGSHQKLLRKMVSYPMSVDNLLKLYK